MVLVNSLQSKMSNVTANYPDFDSNYTIRVVEFPIIIPTVLYISNLSNFTWFSMSFVISLNNYGKVFAVAMPRYSNITTVVNNTSNATSSTNSTSSTNTTTNTSVTTNSTIDNSLSVPTSFQIYKGYNSENLNVNVINKTFEVSNKSANFTFTIDGLTQNLSYVVFLTIGNTHPYIPDLQENSKIVTLFGKTEIKIGKN